MIRNTVRTGRSRLTRTLVSVGLAGAAGLALVAVPATSADAAGLKCNTPSCILAADVKAGGLTATLTIRTAPPTAAVLEVVQGGTVVGFGRDTTLSTTHVVTTDAALTPNTTYTWRAWAIDSHSRSVVRTGTLTTLHRRVTVQFLTDTVTSDSDLVSAGDFETAVAVSGQRMFAPLMPETINTGETKLMGAVLVQPDGGPTTQISTEMYDDDSPIEAWFPSLSAIDWSTGWNPIGDWATATGTVNTTAATGGLVPFQISVSSIVGFVVRGYYAVAFVS